MADDADSKSVVRKGVWVQVPPPALKKRFNQSIEPLFHYLFSLYFYFFVIVPSNYAAFSSLLIFSERCLRSVLTAMYARSTERATKRTAIADWIRAQ